MRYGITLLILFSFLAGGKSWAEEPIDLAPMERPPSVNVGFKWLGVDGKGEAVSAELVERAGDIMTFVNQDGCRWSTKGFFAPSVDWKRCGGNSGSHRVTYPDSAEVWPLSVGKEWSYYVHGRNSQGHKWQGKRSCKVESTVKITAAIGSVDTFKVVCNDPWNKRTSYLSPEHEATVRFERYHKRSGKTFKRDLTSKILAN